MSFFNTAIVTTLPFVPKPIVAQFAKKYIAGETLSDAVATVRQLNSVQAMTTIDALGEDVVTQEQAIVHRDQSIAVLNTIAEQKIDSNLSVKLTSFGLKIDKDFCRENFEAILAVAASHKIFVRIDMEDHTCTDDTLALYRTLRVKYPNIGVVIQSYLHRSEDDVKKLASENANVRMVKGIYKEPASVAIHSRREIQQNFVRLTKILLEAQCYVAIATHDETLFDASNQIIRDMKLSAHQYEYQMLLGVREERRNRLIKEGHRMRIYTPYGKDWFGYSVRRLKENPHMAGHVFKAMFGIGQ